jgi:hypothetical protein
VKVKEGDLTTDRSIFEFVQDYLNRESRQDQSGEQPNRNRFSPLRSKASFLPEPKTDDSAEADQTDWRLITASLRTIISVRRYVPRRRYDHSDCWCGGNQQKGN